MPVRVLSRQGDLVELEVELAGPASYTTGGTSLGVIDEVSEIVSIKSASITGGYYISAAECKASGNEVTAVIRYFNYPATSAGVAEEVAAGTDLSSETVKLIILAK